MDTEITKYQPVKPRVGSLAADLTKFQVAMNNLSVALGPLLFQGEPDQPVIRPYATMDACGHTYIPEDPRSYVDDAAELSDLMLMNVDRAQRISLKFPHRANEIAPGCVYCSTFRAIHQAKRLYPIHWRLN